MLSSEDLERFYFQYQTEAVLSECQSRHSVYGTMFHITFFTNGTRIPAKK